MSRPITLTVNGQTHTLDLDPETPLLYVLRNDLGLKGPKFGCGLEQCHACAVLVDGADVPSCQLPVERVEGLAITTVEGLGTPQQPHDLQLAFMEEQAIQCGYCVSGMIIAAQGLLNRVRYPTDEQIREALATNLCRCGTYERVRRAIRARIGQMAPAPIYEVQNQLPLPATAPARNPSLESHPQLDSWIRIDEDETVTVLTGKVEIGQGIKTALAQIAAEELDVDLARVQIVTADTERTPDEGVTSGSRSLETSGEAIRQAAAEARHLLLTLAFEELEAETALEELLVADGVISDPATGRSVSYWQLAGGKPFSHTISGIIKPKAAGSHQYVGQPVPRLDLLPKVTGQPSFVHDLDLPDMLHGRVVRPPGYNAILLDADLAAIEQMPGVVKVVRDGSFLGVIAAREEQAVAAAAALREKAHWQNDTDLPPEAEQFDHIRQLPSQDALVLNGATVPDPIPPREEPAGAHLTLSADYHRPYQMHGSLGPSAAVAQFVDGKLTIWSPTQGPFPQRAAISDALGMAPEAVHVIQVEGAGCYGHNGADDVGLDAALLALAMPGRPISLKWERADEHGWEPYGPAMSLTLSASLDESGQVISWNHDVWSYPHLGRPRSGDLMVAAWHRAEPLTKPRPSIRYTRHVGGWRNADPLYAFPVRRIVAHFVPDSPLRTSALRTLGGYGNVFAIESFMDELAEAAGVDPVEFRLRHLDDPRAIAVIEAAAAKANWQPGGASPGAGRGRGFAFSQYKNIQCYTAIVVDISVDKATGAIKLERAVIAADAGQVVNPDGLSNQLEGGFVQGASWALYEGVHYEQKGITSLDWESYPILRFDNAPYLETVILNRPDQPFLGSGEATQGPTPAAIANALYAATGIRHRQMPFTRQPTS
ncbi:MAG: molybdopterin-dependent oxidoreductase [Ardenticatenales bacterium]|nr:molybdopterin-dependent oxidoreductase [Ardenticatenales bacterium]